jgi:D-glycero-alpha-D-manno-heptose 1-phosphate guanylyltransferase
LKGIDAIILAGGLGTRIRQVVPDVPKPLAPVGGRPFLDILLAYLDRYASVGRVILAVCHQADRIVAAYGGRTGYRFALSFSVEERPLGTGGAVRKALEFATTRSILVMNGDTFVEVDVDELGGFHLRHGMAATVVACRVEDAGRYGIVRVDGEGRVTSFEEKRPDAGAGTVNAGVYVLDRRLFDAVPADRVVSLERDLLPEWIGKGIRAFPAKGRFIDIGVPESYRRAPAYLKEFLK